MFPRSTPEHHRNTGGDADPTIKNEATLRRSGKIYKNNPTPTGNPWLLVIPKTKQLELLEQMHDHPTSGHMGIKRTYSRIKDKYFWPSMFKTVEKYVSSCPECQFRKTPSQQPSGQLQPIPPASRPFERIGIDLLGRFPKSINGNRWIVVCTDYYSRHVETAALPRGTATEIADFFLKKIVLRHGAPIILISDRGSSFLSKLLTQVLKICNTIHKKTTSYHPQTNGQTERMNRTLTDMISMYIDEKHQNWDEILPFVTFAYNSSVQETTGYSPYFLIHGREPLTFLDSTFDWPEVPPKPGDFDDYISNLLTIVEESKKISMARTMARQDKSKHVYDKHRREANFSPDDLVLIWTPIRKVGRADKLQKNYIGPFKIIRKTSPVNYEVKEVTGRGKKIVHVSRMKLYRTPDLRTTGEICRQLENMKQRSIKRTRYERLPNVTPISSDFEEDLALKIRRIVQEELQKIMPEMSEVESFRTTDVISLEAIVKEDVQQVLAPITRRSIQSQRRRTFVRRFRREDDYTPYATRTSDQWRMVDNQPICFHCGKPGHVLRYFRERRRTFEDARLRRTLPAADNASTPRPYDLNDDFPTLPRPEGITKLDQKIEAMIDLNLTENQQIKLMNILKNISDVFDFSGKSQPARSKIKHKIDTGDHAPTKQRPYRMSGMERIIIQQEVDRMMEQDIIQFSESPWSSPVILVKKENGSWRFCVDYRRLNKITKKDVYPLLRVDDALDNLSGARYYLSMDLRTGYWQIEVDEHDREKTAFITPDGLYEFRIITDRGTNYMSQIIKEINNLSGISHLKTTAYHPQTNGLPERLNKTLIDMLSMYVDVEQKNWDEVLSFVTFAYNTAKQETTGFSPFFLVHGREAETTLDSLLPYHDNDNVGDYVQHLITTAEEARHHAQLHLYRGQEKDRVYNDRKYRPVDYNVGDLVSLFIPVRKVGLLGKLIKKYFGPYRITRKLSHVNYEFEAISDSPKHREIRDTVHVHRMRPNMDPLLQEEISDSTPNEEPVLKQRFSDPETISGPVTRSRARRMEIDKSTGPFHRRVDRMTKTKDDQNEEGKKTVQIEKRGRAKMEEPTRHSNKTTEQSLPQQETIFQEQAVNTPMTQPKIARNKPFSTHLLNVNVIPPDLITHLNPYPEINVAREIARSRTQNKHKKDKETFDKQHRTPHFEVNDLVMVKNYRHPDTGKLAPYFTGPYTIIEIISPNVVRIDRPNKPLNRDSDIIHTLGIVTVGELLNSALSVTCGWSFWTLVCRSQVG
ncbi:K02A2.6-like, partial [Cordylochernes scorpioides]